MAQHPSVEYVEIKGTICEEDVGNVGAVMGNLVDACYGVQDEYNVNGEVGETGASEELIASLIARGEFLLHSKISQFDSNDYSLLGIALLASLSLFHPLPSCLNLGFAFGSPLELNLAPNLTGND
ncbi:hypothetical protein LguiA_020369 [Lonicera macranthoides]